MQEVIASNDAISQLRATNREDLSALRKKDREALLRQKRLALCEVEALVTNITLDQFKEFILKVKEKKATLEVLKAIKNNCYSPTRTEAFFKIDGALNSLIRILVGRDAHLQLEAAACLTNLACGSHKSSHRIAKAAGPYLVTFINSGSCYLQDQSAWAAGNIANDCFECFSLLKAQGLIPALLATLQSSVPDVIRSAVFALNACTKYGDSNLRELAESGIVNCLLRIINQENIPDSTLCDAAFILSNIYYLSVLENIDLSDSSVESVLTFLYKLLSRTEIDTLTVLPLIRCLGFMSKSDSVCLHLSHNASFHHSVQQILNSDLQCLRIEILWVLTNISVYGDIIPEVIDLNLIFKIMDIKGNLVDSPIMQVLYFLCTWATRSERVQKLLQQEEFMSMILPFLNCGEKMIENATKIVLEVIK